MISIVEKTQNKNDLKELKKTVTIELKKFGISPEILGFHYIRESIIYLIEKSGNTFPSVTKELYPTIAKRFNTTSGKVERAIRHAIESVFLRNKEMAEEAIMEYFCISYPEGKKPTNSEFLCTVADYIRLNLL